MIRVKNISYSYGGKNGSPVLKDISFDISPGECVGILGNNGAGKSTLLTCLCKIRTPQNGNLSIGQQELYQMKRSEIAKHISYVAQKSEMSQMTVFDAVLLGRKPYIRQAVSKEDLAICEQMIAQVGISDLKLRYTNELSGGEQQKVMLARALVQEPKLLLLDEPASNLDPRNQVEMLALVQKIARDTKVSVLMVLHDLSLALRYCDRFLFLKYGKVYKYGDDSIVTRETVVEVYGIDGAITLINGQKIFVPD